MRNIIFIAIAGLILAGCQSEAEKAENAYYKALVDSIFIDHYNHSLPHIEGGLEVPKNDGNYDSKAILMGGGRDSSVLVAIAGKVAGEGLINKPYSNPVFIMGSSFGNYFQTLYKLGDYEQMLKFTTVESVKNMGGHAVVKKLYSKMKFAYDMKLKSKTVNGDTITLNYEAGIFATKHMIRIPVMIENDTAKLVLMEGIFL